MTAFAILIPAAGASSRMRGTDKLLQDVGGAPCLRAMALRARAVSDVVIVTLPGPDHPRAACLQGVAVTQVMVPDADLGMSRSLVRGGAAVPFGHGAMVLPADMPALTRDDIAAVARGWAGHSIRRGATAAGQPGHPILFPAALLPRFAGLTGDKGAAPILTAPDVIIDLVTLPGDHARLDLDTPEA